MEETLGQIEWASMNQFVKGNRCLQQQPIGLNPMRHHKLDKLRLPLKIKRRSNVSDWLEIGFVCNKLFIPVVFKTHPQECATRNNYKDEFPPLAGDLMKLTDPSSLLIELYHRSLTEDILATKDSSYNKSSFNTSGYNSQSIKVSRPTEETSKQDDNHPQE